MTARPPSPSARAPLSLRRAAGAAGLLAAAVLAGAGQAADVAPVPYACGAEAGFDLRVGPERATLRIGGTVLRLQASQADPDGGRYANPDAPAATLRLEGWTPPDPPGPVSVTLPGGTLSGCLPDATAMAAPFVAQGNEPPWRLTVQDGKADLRQGYDSTLTQGGRVLETAQADGADARLRITGTKLVLSVADRVTRDSMSGLPYPAAVTLEGPDGTLHGTGGDPARLLEGTPWSVVAIDGAPLPEGLAATLSFRDGRIGGSTGCNRVMGRAEVTGEGLRLGPLGSTMMACPEPAMTAERRLLDALETVSAHDLADDGTLLLKAGDRIRLQLRAALLVP